MTEWFEFFWVKKIFWSSLTFLKNICKYAAYVYLAVVIDTEVGNSLKDFSFLGSLLLAKLFTRGGSLNEQKSKSCSVGFWEALAGCTIGDQLPPASKYLLDPASEVILPPPSLPGQEHLNCHCWCSSGQCHPNTNIKTTIILVTKTITTVTAEDRNQDDKKPSADALTKIYT